MYSVLEADSVDELEKMVKIMKDRGYSCLAGMVVYQERVTKNTTVLGKDSYEMKNIFCQTMDKKEDI